jgi:hypothetical protein
MSIGFACSQCGKKLKTKDELAGKRVVCPYCRATVNVPDEVVEPEVVDAEVVQDSYDINEAEPESSEPSVRRKADSRRDDEDDEERRPCPMCGEMIRVNAGKCRYCGEIFDPTLRRLERKRKGTDSDSMTTGDWVVAILCSGIGCIAGIIWTIQGKGKGPKMIGVSLAMVAFWTLVRLLIYAAAGAQ